MLAALVVVVLVPAAEAQSAQTSGVALALEEALESGSVVVVQAAARPEDEDLAAIGSAAHADAVAAVSFTASDGSHAHLRVQRVGAGTAAERDIEFKRSDASVERGKTVGFALASMLPRVDASTPRPDVKVTAPPAKESPVKDDSVKTPSWGVDLAFGMAIGLGGTGGGLGGAIGLRREITPAVDAHAALAVLRGNVSEAEASITLVRPRAGIGIVVLRRQSVAARARVEAGPWLLVLDRPGVGPTSGSRWTAGAGASAEVEWTVAPSVALTFEVGLDVAFGTTRVIVGGEERASIAPFQAVGGPGVRILF